MSGGPWEDYAPTQASGPWDDFKTTAIPAVASQPTDNRRWDQVAADAIQGAENYLTPQPVQNAMAAIAARPELQPYGLGQQGQPTSVVGSALQAAGQTLAAPIRTGATLMASPDIVGEGIATGSGASDNPYVRAGGVAVGGAVQMAPYLYGAYKGYQSLNQSTNPSIAGRMNTSKELGPQYSAQNEAIGISSRSPETAGKLQYQSPYSNPLTISPKRGIPVQTDMQSNLVGAEPLPSNVPTKYPSDPGTLINTAEKMVQTHGANLNPQILQDFKTLISNAMNTGDIAQYDAVTHRVTPQWARASQVKSMVNDVLNQVAENKLPKATLPEGTIPTRSGLNQAYGIAANREAVGNLMGRYLKLGAGGTGAIGASVYGIKKLLGYLGQ